MGLKEDRKRERKRRLFRRDGWQDADGEWFAMCAYGCGTVIGWHEAIINLYPLKKPDGGRYTFDNTRLACRPCHTVDCDHTTLPKRRIQQRRAAARKRAVAAPQPVSVSARIDAIERFNARRNAAQSEVL
ncbi:hypothetical protein PBI_BIGNUZ_62 [Mycobacterium phage BigNuz]|uniref:HNH endonuclease n=1 Tax=Mycobacterium phage BigNuz TaxID=1074309 RepID=G1JX77_9CAUD|nr:hypothetical protein PBI_BIGNUZ_62 [Mycobacterium phage BigNuz]AEL98224.1 hypothetical protein PBI_BIGNUZ_62 [Mycobacterium phage BigNuz]